MYFMIIISMIYLCLIVTISELIIIISILCISSLYTWYYYNKGIIDGIILNDSNYIVISINVILCMVSNYIIYIWYSSNICNMIINYILVDVGIYSCLILFIELQCKEYINYNSYMNESINISIIFIMLGIHLLHISICYIIILCLYIYCIFINYYSIIYIYIINYSMYINIIFSMVYYHLVSLLYFIINIIIL